MAVVLDQQLQANLARYAELCAAAGYTVHVERLPAILEQIVDFYQPVKLYMFGSLVRGDFTADSDVDLLLIVPDAASQEQRNGLAAMRTKRGSGLAMDVLVYRQSRFNELKDMLSLVPGTAAEEGKVLYAA